MPSPKGRDQYDVGYPSDVKLARSRDEASVAIAGVRRRGGRGALAWHWGRAGRGLVRFFETSGGMVLKSLFYRYLWTFMG